jgi:hypothetical protein
MISNADFTLLIYTSEYMLVKVYKALGSGNGSSGGGAVD